VAVPIDPAAARTFATRVVQQLRDADYEAYWAGGCVRDDQMGRTPKDYDVATSATPAQVREVFGRRRTLPIGAAFGVIAVRGPREAGLIEVATFREDATYSDGRRPDDVVFSTAENDAQRRDFTINGMFFDPLEDRVIDFVGGAVDLQAGVIRAIGDPHHRIAEDKLRLMRAVRFAATYGFEIEPVTYAAVCQHAAEVNVVSAERIAMEMQRMLKHASRAAAVQLLRNTGLLVQILPEPFRPAFESDTPAWAQSQQMLSGLQNPSFPLALAALLWAAGGQHDGAAVEETCNRWKLSNEDSNLTGYLLHRCHEILASHQAPWPQLQRLLITPEVHQLMTFSHAVATATGAGAACVEHARTRLALPATDLNPLPILNGNDLKEAGVKPGPQFKQLLEAVRNAQLEKQISTTAEAVELARQLLQ